MPDRPKSSKLALKTSKLLRVLVVGGAVLAGATIAAGCPGKNSDGTAAKPDKPGGGGAQGW